MLNNSRRGQGIGQGPANGPGDGNPKFDLTAPREVRSARATTGWLKRKMRAYAEANPDSVAEQAPSRTEIAELARAKMPLAVDRLELILHTSRSDMAAVQAYNALRETAYGKDAVSLNVAMRFEEMTDAELRAALARELAATNATGGGAFGGITETAAPQLPD